MTVAAQRASIHASQDSKMTDERLAVVLRGLEPGSLVILEARTIDDEGIAWSSSTTFRAGADGCVDLDHVGPKEGGYARPDAAGILWSMRPETNGDPEPTAPFFAKSGTNPLRLSLALTDADGQPLARCDLTRLRVAEGSRRVELTADGLRGVLYLPPGPGPHPGLIHLLGSDGGLSEGSAATYASRGYATLALAYFNYADLPESLSEIPLEYFERAIAWLSARPEVEGSRIGLQGVSRGGELVLLLASRLPEVRAVISYAPSSVAWSGFGSDSSEGRPAWTWRGQPVRCMDGMKLSGAVVATIHAGAELARRGDPVALTPNFLAYLEDRDEVQAAAIRLEDASAAVLLIAGEDDQMWPAAAMAEAVVRRLAAAEYGHAFEVLSYPGAGHLIGRPGHPTTTLRGVHPMNEIDYAYGGTPEGDAHACRDSWERVLAFLAEHL